MKTEKSCDEALEKSQLEMYTYIDWLYNTGRLTTDEHSILVDHVTECVTKAISFGYSEEYE